MKETKRNYVLIGLLATSLTGLVPIAAGEVGDESPPGEGTIGAAVYLQHERWASASSFSETDTTYEYTYLSATSGRDIQYTTDSPTTPGISAGSTMVWASVGSCLKTAPYTCTYDGGYGVVVPDSAFVMDPVMGAAHITATLTRFSGGTCEVDASFTASALPQNSNSTYTGSDPNGGFHSGAFTGHWLGREAEAFGTICGDAWEGTFDYAGLLTGVNGLLRVWFNPDAL